MSETLAYKSILDDIKQFKRSGTKYGHDFNLFDTPSHKYFKILFYFGSAPELFENDSASGFLAPTWELFNIKNNTSEGTTKTDYYNYNSAWAYLKMNNEEERAEKLEQFVTLLSDINTYSPWYFNTVGGLTDALTRKVVDDGKLDLTEPKHLTITCLPDAFDNRITTLLELYRDIVWSWTQKKEMVPANLRKFDMAVYIFETPEFNWHKDTDIIGTNNVNSFTVSYKMIEFHDCEFGYNSIATGWSDLNNETGFAPKYTIDISYRDCYEISYNDIMMRKIGDVILTDMLNSPNDAAYVSVPQSDNNYHMVELEKRMTPIATEIVPYENDKRIVYFGNIGERTGKATENIETLYKYEYKPGFIETAVGQVAGHLVKDVKSLFTKAILGNLHTYSLTQIGAQLGEAMQGNLIKAGMTAAQYIKNAQQRKADAEQIAPDGNIYLDTPPESTKTSPTGDIFPNTKIKKSRPYGDIFPNTETKKSKPFGNIFNKKTLANNL